MSKHYTCIAVDDDPILLRKLEVYIEKIPWITFLESHYNPVQGATAIVKQQPDIILLDIEMPHIDGYYLIDWIQPKLAALENPPQVIVISSLNILEEDQAPGVTGYINKADLNTPEDLEIRLKTLIS